MIYVDMSQRNLFVLSNYVESRPEMQNQVFLANTFSLGNTMI